MTTPFGDAVSLCKGFLSSIVLLSVLAGQTVYATDTDARQRGAMVFQTKGCEHCHSILGAGGDRASDLGTIGQRWTANRIRTQVINGGHGMPPFGKILSKDVVVFLILCKTYTAPGCRQWMQPEPEHKAQ